MLAFDWVRFDILRFYKKSFYVDLSKTNDIGKLQYRFFEIWKTFCCHQHFRIEISEFSYFDSMEFSPALP